jgi:flagellar biosynthesis protein FlhG
VKPLSEQDYYETLEIARGASFEEIERAYRLACGTYAPDSLAGHSVFEEGDLDLLRERVEMAYRTLADPEARRSYDEDLARGVAPEVGPIVAAELDAVAGVSAAPEVVVDSLDPLEALEDLEDADGDFDGARLRRSRLRRGVDLEEIASVTKVNPTYLTFIEEERFDDLPAAVYVRGFVIGYASCVGLDPKRVAQSYMRRYEEHRSEPRRTLFHRGR